MSKPPAQVFRLSKWKGGSGGAGTGNWERVLDVIDGEGCLCRLSKVKGASALHGYTLRTQALKLELDKVSEQKRPEAFRTNSWRAPACHGF